MKSGPAGRGQAGGQDFSQVEKNILGRTSDLKIGGRDRPKKIFLRLTPRHNASLGLSRCHFSVQEIGPRMRCKKRISPKNFFAPNAPAKFRRRDRPKIQILGRAPPQKNPTADRPNFQTITSARITNWDGHRNKMNLRRNVRTKKKIGLLTKTNTEIGPNLETSGVMATRLNRVYPFAAGRLGPVLCQVANMAAASESDAASQVGVAPSEGDASSVPAPTAAGSLASAPTGWHLTPLTSDQKAAADSMQAILDDFDNRVLGDYGGPAQFLRAKLSSRESISAFGSWLWSTFPLSGNMEYSLCKSDVKQ